MKNIVFMLVGLFSFTEANSQTRPDPDKIIDQVFQVARSYADTIACEVSLDRRDVLSLAPYVGAGTLIDTKYAVLWRGDIGCSGGSGTTFNEIMIIGIGAYEFYFVDPAKSSPNVRFDSPSVIEQVVSYTQDTIVIKGYEYSEEDALCCPSLPVEITLQSDAEGNWEKLDQSATGAPKEAITLVDSNNLDIQPAIVEQYGGIDEIARAVTKKANNCSNAVESKSGSLEVCRQAIELNYVLLKERKKLGESVIDNGPSITMSGVEMLSLLPLILSTEQSISSMKSTLEKYNIHIESGEPISRNNLSDTIDQALQASDKVRSSATRCLAWISPTADEETIYACNQSEDHVKELVIVIDEVEALIAEKGNTAMNDKKYDDYVADIKRTSALYSKMLSKVNHVNKLKNAN